MKTISLREFIDAIEKNGFIQTRGYLFETEHEYFPDTEYLSQSTGPIIRACALGQAYINLGIKTLPIGAWNIHIMDTVINRNDSQRQPLNAIAADLRIDYADYLDKTIEAEEFDYSSYLGERE